MARKTGVYRNLIRGDLTARIHVVADAGMILWSAPGGLVAAPVLEEVWVPGGFQEVVEALAAEGQVAVVFRELIDFVKGRGDDAVLVILKKITCD
ncbi:uncharacterized protein BO72DRAFT_530674 [Aspergillus fijiensis CBS 313.89]|uniref:Uncharacterized protein n=1 Tax=Aspergillus fijiensis CBS 313.89 TaxID=1448319 RepID=A0A8G1VVB0_9EURO|nr:uncharacterized protein BO72DRAFT_530674 [Aspergillus fijiensis CBS 313.89]RAK73952.1 hypothetical protein BO72DRAFT_530674 [Aspergillus fijiensis CBS 313.89]